MHKVQCSVLTRSADVELDFCHAVNLGSLAFLGVQEDVEWCWSNMPERAEEIHRADQRC